MHSSSSKKKIRCALLSLCRQRTSQRGGEVGERKNMEENMEVKYYGGKYGRKPPSAWNWRGGFLPYLPPYFFATFWGDRQKYGGKYGGLALEIMGLSLSTPLILPQRPTGSIGLPVNPVPFILRFLVRTCSGSVPNLGHRYYYY
jgi:hypothetical protein